MLQDQMQDLKKAIDAKRAEIAPLRKTADEKRDALKAEDIDLTATSGPELDKAKAALDAADEAYKPYSKASEELRTMEGQFERLAMMAADGGDRTVNSRTENELDRHPHEARRSLGALAVESDEYKAMAESGAFHEPGLKGQISPAMDRAEFKAALLTGTSGAAGGVLNVPERFPGVVDLPQLPLGIFDLITVGETDSNSVEFVRLLARTINAAEVLEAASTAEIGDGTGGTTTAALGGVKPESGLTFEEVVQAVKNIAHWIPATRNTLADAALLRTLIDSEMRQGVERRAERQVIQGNGTGANLLGIKNTPGIASYTQGTDVVGEPAADAIHRKFTLLRLAGFEPTGEVVHPSDWQEIRLSKDDNKNYIWGPPSLAGQMQIWGTPVVSSIATPEGESYGAEWARALFLIREAVKILVSDSHKDWFTRNIVAILAEMRGVLVVPRPQAFGKTQFV